MVDSTSRLLRHHNRQLSVSIGPRQRSYVFSSKEFDRVTWQNGDWSLDYKQVVCRLCEGDNAECARGRCKAERPKFGAEEGIRLKSRFVLDARLTVIEEKTY